MNIHTFASDRYRWIALAFLALGLAIVIIDNTVLNVAVPAIAQELGASLDAMQWVIAGYALIIATLLVTMGRLGDVWGRKRIFVLGTVLFGIGSFMASVASSVETLFIGEAVIEAIGASMMLTSSLSLLVSEFRGRERALAFGVWGSVAGASAALGPLLGGYLTAYYSWRWSLRINVIVALVAIAGSVFIKESRGEGERRFDWMGTLLSGGGLFMLVFGLIEGQRFGWWAPTAAGMLGGAWPLGWISPVPVSFLLALILLSLFAVFERSLERKGESPLLRMSLFRHSGFTQGLVTLLIVSLGQFGVFFSLPLFLQNALGFDAFHTGLALLASSLGAFAMGPLSGLLASRIKPVWVVFAGMVMLSMGALAMIFSIGPHVTAWDLAPALAMFGIGIGMTSAQLTNIILSSVPVAVAGEASAVNSTMRQIGTSVGIAVMGTILASTLASSLASHVQADAAVPVPVRERVAASAQSVQLGEGRQETRDLPAAVRSALDEDVRAAFVDGTRSSLWAAFAFLCAGTFLTLALALRHPSGSGGAQHAHAEI
jgi:EmrB/QacA subfamily drug resistance transporter